MPEDMAQGRTPASSTEALRERALRRRGGGRRIADRLLVVPVRAQFAHRPALLCARHRARRADPAAAGDERPDAGLRSSRSMPAAALASSWAAGSSSTAGRSCWRSPCAAAPALPSPMRSCSRARGRACSSLAERGRVAGLVAVGAVVMLAIAGVLEGHRAPGHHRRLHALCHRHRHARAVGALFPERPSRPAGGRVDR